MFIQITTNVAIAASLYLLVALSFVIIFKLTRFFHFAHGIVFTAGAYLTLISKNCLGVSPLFSFISGIAFCTILGCLMDLCIYRPLRKKGSSELILLLASLGIYVFLQNTISMIFGDETKSIRIGDVQVGINILGARITPIQIITICASIVLVIALSTFLKKSKIGNAMRAVANDSVLANVSGINSNRVILWAFAIGSALAGLAGLLVALDVDMTPTMGMSALMMGVVVVIIGGVNSIGGIALGALLLATAQHLGAWFIGSQWQDAIAFIILVLFLLFKPEGFFGKKIRSTTV